MRGVLQFRRNDLALACDPVAKCASDRSKLAHGSKPFEATVFRRSFETALPICPERIVPKVYSPVCMAGHHVPPTLGIGPASQSAVRSTLPARPYTRGTTGGWDEISAEQNLQRHESHSRKPLLFLTNLCRFFRTRVEKKNCKQHGSCRSLAERFGPDYNQGACAPDAGWRSP